VGLDLEQLIFSSFHFLSFYLLSFYLFTFYLFTFYQMSVPLDKKLYEKAKRIADEKYSKPSAYKSGFIVKTYKDMGGTYKDTGERKGLKEWFQEQWADIGNRSYPVFRPTKRVSKDTPLTPNEIDPENLKHQIALKQKIKGTYNLPPFFPKNEK